MTTSRAWKIHARADSTVLRDYRKRNVAADGYLSRLVTDEKFARDSVAPGLMPYLYWVLANTQSHTGQPWILPEVFSVDEVRQAWRQDNGMWVLHSINSPLTDNRMPLIQLQPPAQYDRRAPTPRLCRRLRVRTCATVTTGYF